MPDVLLLNPPLSTKQRYDAFSGIANVTPPLGLCSLASSLRIRGHRVSILDAAAREMGLEACVKTILETSPTHVGITTATASIHSAAQVARRLKELSPGITIIVGGPHLSALPEQTMAMFPQFDFGVAGEGEITAVELLEALERRAGLEATQGVVYRNDGSVRATGPRQPLDDLDRLPMPAWDLLPNLTTHYSPTLNAYKRWPSTSLVTSRGCPNQCIYCGSFVFGNRYRSHSASYVIRMMLHLKTHYGIRDIYFHDDTFMVDKARLEELCMSMRQNAVDMTWACFGRVADVRQSDLPLLRRMKEAGCWQISFGVESGSDAILKILKKGITTARVREAVSVAKRAGISVNGFFILGSPGETAETIEETLRLIKTGDFDTVQTSYFTPFPGTEAYRRAHLYGELREDWNRFTTWHPVFIPKGLTEEDLTSASRRALIGFYTNPRHVLRLAFKSANTRHFLQLLKAARILGTLAGSRKARAAHAGPVP